ncbi:MAG TPA: hypothetical protein VKW09_10990 [bacterium]|nr:hypothetical protein [bacterium]
METEFTRLQRDLDRFDRRTRALGAAGLAVAVLVAVLFAGARQAVSQPESLSGRTVALVDDAGRQRIVLGSDTGNRPGIWLRDEGGKDRVWFGFGAPRGTPQLSLNDETGRTRLAAGFSVERGDAQMAMFDPAGTPRAYLGFGVQLRTPQLVLDDEHGKDRIYAGWTQDGATILHLVDESGTVVWRAPAPGTSTGGANPGTNRKSGGP